MPDLAGHVAVAGDVAVAVVHPGLEHLQHTCTPVHLYSAPGGAPPAGPGGGRWRCWGPGARLSPSAALKILRCKSMSSKVRGSGTSCQLRGQSSVEVIRI